MNLVHCQKQPDHSMIETRHLKNVVIFVQTILSFVLSRKISTTILHVTMEMLQLKIFENMKN